MATYRPIFTKLWKDPDFEEYTAEQKLIFLYLCTNENTTQSGIYQITLKTISNDTSIPMSKLNELINHQNSTENIIIPFNLKNVYYDLSTKTIFIRNFLIYNKGKGGRPELLHQAILNDNKYIKTSLWSLFINQYPEFKDLQPYNNLVPTLCQPCANLTTTLPNPNPNPIPNPIPNPNPNHTLAQPCANVVPTLQQGNKEKKEDNNNLDFCFKKLTKDNYIKLLSAKIQILDWNELFVRFFREVKPDIDKELILQHLILWAYKGKSKITNPLSILKVIYSKIQMGELTTDILSKSDLYEQIGEFYDPVYEKMKKEQKERESSQEYKEYRIRHEKEQEELFRKAEEEQKLNPVSYNPEALVLVEKMKLEYGRNINESNIATG